MTGTQTGLDPVSSFHPSTKAYRFTLLIFVSLLSFGSYFAYDVIGAVAPRLIEELGASRTTLGSMYTVYSIAAIISVLIGGFMIDRLGTRKASMIFSILLTIGAAIVAFSDSLPVLFAGRFIFGAGSEPLIVAQSAIIARWFKGKELAFSFGVTLTVSRLGTLFSFNTGELISSYFGGYRYALIAAALFCLVSLAANVVYIIMDKKAEKALNLADESGEDKIVLSDIKFFKSRFWYVTLLCLAFYSAIFPFTALSTDFFVDKWSIIRVVEPSGGFLHQAFNNFFHMFSTAGGITSIPIFASMIAAPFAGHLLDKYGKRATVMIYGSLFLIVSHLLLGVTDVYPAYPMIILGLAFVLVPAAMWPCIPMIVDKKRVGTAFGLMTMIQAIGLSVFPFLNGLMRDLTNTYTASMLMFASLGVAGLVFAILLRRADAKKGNVLENP